MIILNISLNGVKHKFVDLIIQGVTENVTIDQLSCDEINSVIKYAKYHSVENIIYKSLKNANITIPHDFEKLCMTLFQKAIVQDCEYVEIIKQFNSKKIYHLPLKGAILRKFYPSFELRNMCDLDILVQKSDLKKVNAVLTELGYLLEKEGGHHDVYIKSPFMNIEIHRTMLDEEFNNFKYYDNIWKKIIKNNNEYSLELTNEDFYIYNIVHAWKHFSEGGTGVKILIDIYYILQNNQNLDFEYINFELKQIKLDVFAECLYKLTNKLFNNCKLNEDEIFLLDYIIDSGTYGNLTHSSAGGILKEEKNSLKFSRGRFLIKRLFPSFKVLKEKYPILENKPILTPFYWFKRLFSVLFDKNRRNGYLNSLNCVDQSKIDRIKKIKEITNI